MSEKQYAIVRVDDNFIDVIIELQTLEKVERYQKIKIDYGDTKEQLIRKVAQAIQRKYFDTKLLNKKGAKFTLNMAQREYKELAKEIVEFLGVE